MPPSGDVLAITNVRVFDGEQTLPRATVLVQGGNIADVGNVTVPPGATVMDGSGKTLLPGLIDAHTHTWDDGDLKQALVLGVTTELDMMGDPAFLSQNKPESPDGEASLFGCGNPVTVPGGHGTEYGFTIPTLGASDDPSAFVTARIAEGSEYIKLMHEDGMPYGFTTPTLTQAQLAGAIAAAHAHNRLAVVHISTQQRASEAIAAGADGLAHLYLGGSDDTLAQTIASHQQFVIATLSVEYSICGGNRAAMLLADPDLSPWLGANAVARLQERFPSDNISCTQLPPALQSLVRSGVEILAGTDANNPGTAHGASLHDELSLLVQDGLATATDALKAATSAPARRFGLSDRGRIARGLRADLVLVDGDPTTHIEDTRHIAAIWKRGVPVQRAKP